MPWKWKSRKVRFREKAILDKRKLQLRDFPSELSNMNLLTVIKFWFFLYLTTEATDSSTEKKKKLIRIVETYLADSKFNFPRTTSSSHQTFYRSARRTVKTPSPSFTSSSPPPSLLSLLSAKQTNKRKMKSSRFGP